MSLADEWELAELAEGLGLHHMARVQAWHVLSLNANHEEANAFLEHRGRGKRVRWKHDGSWFKPKKFHERISDWDHRFAIEGEHWVLETDAGLRRAVDLMVDLERTYVAWMATYGDLLEAHEFVLDPDRKMTMWVVTDPEENGVGWLLPKEHAPYYSASRKAGTKAGNPNLSITHEENAAYPARFFDVATQQLMYSMLVLGDVRGDLPPDDITRHSHWVELGMGYCFGNRMRGAPGYVALQPFIPNPNVRRLARLRLTKGPLKRARHELTNLVGLEMRQFYLSSERDDVHRAKACSFYQFLEQQDPKLEDRKGRVVHGRDALYGYLREVYGTPKGHSSSALDDCLGGRRKALETLEEPWKEWLGR
jgi:hypothetical protein